MPFQDYKTVRDVAEQLKVSEATVRRWIRDGELRAIDIGKGWRVGANDLGAFLSAHETRPPERSGGSGHRAGAAGGDGAAGREA
ncbi:DNA binding domain-containing protein, excisionase family [Rhodovulum sp. ES.010]|uniref:helix-turn-helix domain-containing protein n=1 Tax=Rhodovulum sp. ES.010 TaxID=1882821 RepID=UPI0009285171|nr:helix-turn-helix domain-containing protein [Rhodovulum sp. ES.010]SIO07020.1 DNA binding domain-containing protein, excisionase family [Rhodovulum sp. ES.010]